MSSSEEMQWDKGSGADQRRVLYRGDARLIAYTKKQPLANQRGMKFAVWEKRGIMPPKRRTSLIHESIL